MTDKEYNNQDSNLINTKELRNTLGTFLTGVNIITTKNNDGISSGITANAFTTVSYDPPLILVCVAKTSRSYSEFRACNSFAVNVLADSQKDLSMSFASSKSDKFKGINTVSKKTGSPIFPESLAWIDCSVDDCIEAGDHIILIGKVQDFGLNSEQPLGYYQGDYVSFSLDQKIVKQNDNREVLAGFIIEDEDKVVLSKTKDTEGKEEWSIPFEELSNVSRGDFEKVASRGLGTRVEMSFLYSVFDSPEKGVLYLIYHGKLKGSLSNVSTNRPKNGSLKSFNFSEIPWESIGDRSVRNMLRRYIKERVDGSFGIYTGSDISGEVATIQSLQKEWEEYVVKIDDIEHS